MNLIKNSKCPLQKQRFFEGVERISFQLKLSVHHKSSPPLKKKSKKDDLYETKPERVLPGKSGKVQRDIFGATILPQNLSFENSKKLTDNQVKLEDIPIVDESAIAEEMMAEKRREKKQIVSKNCKERSAEVKSAIAVIDGFARQQNPPKKLDAEVFCKAQSYEEIPGPNIFRTVLSAVKGFTRQLTVASLLQFLKRNTLEVFRVYGPIVRLPDVLGGKIVLISRPEHISAIFDQDYRYPVNSVLDSIQRARLLQYNKNVSENYPLAHWESLKDSYCNPPVKECEKFFEDIDEASSKFLRRIKVIRNRQDEVPDDFLFEINKWSLECLCQMIFDKSFGFLDCEHPSSATKSSQLLYSLTVATKNLCSLETGFQLWRFMNTYSLSSLSSACSIIENIILENVVQAQINLIKRHVSGDEDLRNLSLVEGLLLRNNLTVDDVVDNILDTLLIGTNIISVALGFLFYHLSQNPRCQTELWKEIKAILPEKYNRLEYEQLDSLKYLGACLKESLRLKMPMPILTRVLSNNVILGNYQVPKGTFILMAGQLERVKEENFSDPTEFLPERWFDQDIDNPFTLFPVRSYFEDSIEAFLAEVSIRVCASHVVRQFFIEYDYEEIQATNTTISFPNKPLKLRFTERKE